MDVMLHLQCNGPQVGHDDDSAGNHHARLVISPQLNAQCIVQVSAYGVARTVGSYYTDTATTVRDRTFLGPRSWFGLDFNGCTIPDPLRPSSMPVAGAE